MLKVMLTIYFVNARLAQEKFELRFNVHALDTKVGRLETFFGYPLYIR